MKNLKYLFLTALVATAGLFTACSSDDDFTPGPEAEGVQVYFPSEAPTAYTITGDMASIEVEVMRAATDEAAEVPVRATIDADYAAAFTVADYVLFEAGESKSKIDIAFDRTKLTEGSSYNIALVLDDETMTTPYGAASLNLTLTIPEPYVLLGTALYREDVITTLFDVDNVEMEVEVYENTNRPGYIFLKNVYTKAYPYTNPKNIYAEGDHYLAVNIADPNEVVIPKQTLGMTLNREYGEFFMGTIEPGTLVNGVITFPVKGLAFGMLLYNDGGAYYANLGGLFRICLPGAVLTDFSLEAAYDGFRVGPDNTTAYPALRVAYGEDVAAVKYVIVEGDITADYAAAVAGIADGSVESTEVKVSGKGEMEIISEEAFEAGVYTVVIVPTDAAGAAQAADAVAVSFYFSGVGAAEVPECDIQVMAVPFSALFPQYSEAYPDSSTFLWVAQGSEIKAMKSLVAPTSEFDRLAALGATLDERIEGNGEDLPENVAEINEEGLTFAFYTNLPAATSFTVAIKAENIYGKTAIVSASGSTAAAAAAAASAKLSWQNRVPSFLSFSKAHERRCYILR